MGAGLAKAAIRVAHGLDHAPARLFFGMALGALDSDPHPVFYRGEEAMATILGAAPSDASSRAVRRALKSLRASCLVESQSSAPGRAARHLLLDGEGAPLSIASGESEDGGRPVSESNSGRYASCEERETADAERTNTGRSAHERRTVSVRTPDGERPPQEVKEEEGRGGLAPSRTCKRHTSWDHDSPCRACAADRKAAEARRVSASSTPRQEEYCNVHAYYVLPCDRCALDAAEAAS
ncbi:hypothetical protein CHE218_05350 [Microbacterium sp. che218]